MPVICLVDRDITEELTEELKLDIIRGSESLNFESPSESRGFEFLNFESEPYSFG